MILTHEYLLHPSFFTFTRIASPRVDVSGTLKAKIFRSVWRRKREASKAFQRDKKG